MHGLPAELSDDSHRGDQCSLTASVRPSVCLHGSSPVVTVYLLKHAAAAEKPRGVPICGGLFMTLDCVFNCDSADKVL